MLVPHDADPAVGAPELTNHSSGNHDSAVYDAVLSYCENAVER